MKRLLLLAVLVLQACASTPPPAPEPSDAAPEVSATAAPPPVLTQPPPTPPVQAAPPAKAETLPKFDGEKVEVEDPLKGLATVDRTATPDDLWERVRRGAERVTSATVRPLEAEAGTLRKAP